MVLWCHVHALPPVGCALGLDAVVLVVRCEVVAGGAGAGVAIPQAVEVLVLVAADPGAGAAGDPAALANAVAHRGVPV